ncbi:LLM class flavin-dependent oxidoreductase [Bacillus cereus]
MEFCWALPLEEDLNTGTIQAIKAENNNFDTILVSSKMQALDPWITASYLCSVTSRIKLLVAQNPNIVDPHISAKAAASLNEIYGNRIDLNIIAGGSSKELLRNTANLTHNLRYKRVREYLEVVNLMKEKNVSYQGKYFSYEDYELFPSWCDNTSPKFFVAGSSNEAMELSAEFGDYYLMYAEDIKSTEEHLKKMKKKLDACNREIKFGIFIAIIARETENEAWSVINNFSRNISSFDKKMKNLYLQRVDSEGILRHKRYLHNQSHFHENNLWSGLSQVSTSISMTIVGSYQQVISTILKYKEIGVDYFLLTSFTDETEIDRVGQYVIPYLR